MAPPADESGRWLDVREAALTLFSERGYQATTMKHLATTLGMQAPSIYNHVVSKQEILRRIVGAGAHSVAPLNPASSKVRSEVMA